MIQNIRFGDVVSRNGDGGVIRVCDSHVSDLVKLYERRLGIDWPLCLPSSRLKEIEGSVMRMCRYNFMTPFFHAGVLIGDLPSTSVIALIQRAIQEATGVELGIIDTVLGLNPNATNSCKICLRMSLFLPFLIAFFQMYANAHCNVNFVSMRMLNSQLKAMQQFLHRVPKGKVFEFAPLQNNESGEDECERKSKLQLRNHDI